MSDVTDEVGMAIGRLALSERVQRLPVEDAARINAELLNSFVVGGDRGNEAGAVTREIIDVV